MMMGHQLFFISHERGGFFFFWTLAFYLFPPVIFGFHFLLSLSWFPNRCLCVCVLRVACVCVMRLEAFDLLLGLIGRAQI